MIIIEKGQPPPSDRPPPGWWATWILVPAGLLVGIGVMNGPWAKEYLPSIVLMMVIVIGFLGLYFVPWMIGLHRDISTVSVLFFVNLLFAWTLIGWFACLIWAAVGATKAQDEFYRKQRGAN